MISDHADDTQLNLGSSLLYRYPDSSGVPFIYVRDFLNFGHSSTSTGRSFWQAKSFPWRLNTVALGEEIRPRLLRVVDDPADAASMIFGV